MSATSDFFNVAKKIIFVTENINALNEKVATIAKNVAGIDCRLIRIETLAEMSQRPARRRNLPGDAK